MLLINETLNGRYRIIRQLGRGGMGAVYEAHDNVFDTTCALKEITIDMAKFSDPQKQEIIRLAFEREAKLLAKIKHEVVPHVRDYFSHENRQYLVMELVEGKDLGELLEERKTPFPLEDVLRWTEQLLDALDYLHTQHPPIFHRDIKPQNLKLTPRGKIKLLDFGIAKGGTETANSSSIGNQTFVAATLNYSPIEQTFRVLDPVFREVLMQKFETRIRDVMQQNADARTDIYALGATIYHLLTRSLPIDSLKRVNAVWAGNPDPLKHPSELNNRIPPEISAFLLKAMEVDRNARFYSAIEMQQALNQAVNEFKTRENQQTQNWQNETPPTVWLPDQKNLQNALPTLEQPFKDAPTIQIPVDQIKTDSLSPTSEQTIQKIPPKLDQQPTQNPFNTGGSQIPPPIGSPFDTSGNTPFSTPDNQSQQPTEQYKPVIIPTGGTASTSPPSLFTGGSGFVPGQVSTNNPSFNPNPAFSNQPFTPLYENTKTKGKGGLFLWIALIFAILFLAVGGGGVGLWLWEKSKENPAKTPTPSPITSTGPSVTPTPIPSPTPSPTPLGEFKNSPTPTPSPTVSPENPTVTKTPVTPKTPVPQPTKTKPKPKKTVSVDDIINDAE
jgi:serine/threonine protein kinase